MSVAELFPCAKAPGLDKEMPSAKSSCNRMLLGLAGSANEGHPAAGEVRSKASIAPGTVQDTGPRRKKSRATTQY